MSTEPAPPAMTWREVVTQDWAANAGYPKSRFILVMFRLAQLVRGSKAPGSRVAYLAVGTAYKLFSEWVLGVELPASTEVGPGLRLRHGVGIVVNPASVIGENVMLRQNVTIGNRRAEDDCPRIEDDVEFGAGAVVIGAIVVGRCARVGAGAVVVKDVPPGGVVINQGTTLLKP